MGILVGTSFLDHVLVILVLEKGMHSAGQIVCMQESVLLDLELSTRAEVDSYSAKSGSHGKFHGAEGYKGEHMATLRALGLSLY